MPFALPPPPPPSACLSWEARGGSRPDSAGSIVSAAYPLRVHWSDADHAGRAADALAHAELAWSEQVDRIGFAAPVLPDAEDGPELDLYLAPVGEWEAYVEPDSWEDAVPGDGRMGTSAWIAIDEDLPDAWLASFVAHEFNHVLQYATDFNEGPLNLWEATAVAAQRWTFADGGQWDEDVPSFQEIPWAPALLGDSYVIWPAANLGYGYEYGAALWVVWLDELFGDGEGALGPLLWDAVASEDDELEPDVLDGIEATAAPLGEALNLLARARALTGARWDDRGLPDAAAWGSDEEVAAASISSPVFPLRRPLTPAPQITGQSFVELDLSGVVGELEISVESASGLRSAVELLTWGADGRLGEDAHAGPAPALTLLADDVDRVVLAVSNLGPPDFDGDDEAYVGGDQVLVIRRAADGAGCSCDAAPPFSPRLPPLALLSLLLGAVPRRRRPERRAHLPVRSPAARRG